jgi:N-acyl-D-aspartate/D-glutamate deacylase
MRTTGHPDFARSTWLRNAVVADGLGGDEFRGEVLVHQGRIVQVRPESATLDRGTPAIDCGGLVLAPGFIDVHSHADGAPFLADDDLSKISQGVTTEVVGNCGFSLAPCPPSRRGEISTMMSRLFPPMAFDWDTVESSYRATDKGGYSINALPLVGHNTIRTAVMGQAARGPTSEELLRMRTELKLALSAGAAGFSSGLAYAPGVYSNSLELAEMARALDDHHVYATHLRSEGPSLMDSLREAIETAALARCRLQVSHLKAAGVARGHSADALALLDEAWDAGVRVYHDVYPYEANSTMLAACLPPWFLEGTHNEIMKRIRDPSALLRAEKDIGRSDSTWDNWVAGSGWDRILISSTRDHRDEGRTLQEVADARDTTPFQTLIEILSRNELKVWMCVFAMDEADVLQILKHPRAVVGSDGPPVGNGGKPHPRLHGTFTRVLGHYVREIGELELTEAIHKMTALPAALFGLKDRGAIAEGAVADLVLLDPTRVNDRATFADPLLLSDGIEMVIIAGRVAYTDSRSHGRHGQRLTSQPRSDSAARAQPSQQAL